MYPYMTTSDNYLWPTPRATKVTGKDREDFRPSLHNAVKNRKLTSSPAATPANLFPLLGKDEAMKMKDISGRKCLELYKLSGRDGSLPKMLLDIFNSVSTPLSHKWKLRTTPAGRLLFQLVPLVHRTEGTESGLWLTPRANEPCENQQTFIKRMGDRSMHCRGSLSAQVMWPTPDASSWKAPNLNPGKNGQKVMPASEHSLQTKIARQNNGGQLNPTWVELLMGYPVGWTEVSEGE